MKVIVSRRQQSRRLFTTDPLTVRADHYLRADPSALTVSDVAAAELPSDIARHVQTKGFTMDDYRLGRTLLTTGFLLYSKALVRCLTKLSAALMM